MNVIIGIWEEFLKIVKEEVGSRVVETWFKAVCLAQWDEMQKTVYLQVPNGFVRDWIKTNYIGLIQLHLGRLLHVESPRVIFLNGTAENQSEANPIDQPSFLAAHKDTFLIPVASPVPPVNTTTSPVTTHAIKNAFLNESYQFETFVVGSNNSLAHAAAYAVTEKPGVLYNPLFIYGGSGLGKTHLMHAIGNRLKDTNPSLSVLYQTADRFVNEFINAIRFEKVHKFQEKYQRIDVLLIDDIQFIAHKGQTQEAFFHIFNALYNAHKQIIFSSDTFPQHIDGMAERLRSRLTCGLVVDIHVPCLETKIAILQRKADLNKIILSDEVLLFIASHADSNIRELEGALIRVIAFSTLTHQPITLALVKKVLLRPRPEGVASIDFDHIIGYLTKEYSYSLSDLRSKKRDKKLSFVRQLAMFFMKRLTDKSLRDIGLFLGGRDHSTVMHAIDKIEGNIKIDVALNSTVRRLEEGMRRV